MVKQRRILAPEDSQLVLPLFPLRNRNFLSNHWLEHRLPLEPEWRELREVAHTSMDKLVSLWKAQSERVALYGDEAGLEEKFIQPIFEALGWHTKYQAYLNGREPDYALFLTDEALNAALHAGRNNPHFWDHAAAVADAKAWHISLDRPTRDGKGREYPPEQIEWYLNRSECNYGILTNGRLWRLVPRILGPSKPRFQTYIEVDLPQLINSLIPTGSQLALGPGNVEIEMFLRFFLFFSPHGHTQISGRKPLVTRAAEGSSEYSLGVGEELKDRVFEALRLSVEGFIKYAPNKLNPDTDLRNCQEHSLIFLYRLLFIMYAEDRALLPYRINQTYTNNRSLARHRDDVAKKLDQLAQKLDRSDYSKQTTHLWSDLQDLFDLIDHGHKSYGVQAYNGGLFDLQANSFLSKHALPDWYLARVLDQLGRASLPDRPELGLFRVDYRDLAIQQLGSVYEGLLELKPRYASSTMRVIRSGHGGKTTELVVSTADPLPKGFEATEMNYEEGSVYLSTDKGERRKSGSYYTPDHIVQEITQRSIGAVCAKIDRELTADIADKRVVLQKSARSEKAKIEREIEDLEQQFADRVLRLKILDPAMGSGHFLIRACQYLAEEIATNPHTRVPEAGEHPGDEPTITFWKRRVSERCLFGVDLNPMAVELAKLALWLETVAADAPLTFLDHHFRCGDSIVGARVAKLGGLPGDVGLFQSQFADEIKAALPGLLEPLAEIRDIPSDTAEHVKQKEQIYRRRFLPTLSRFSTTADLWTAEALWAGSVSREQYAEVTALIGSKRNFDALIEAPWASLALSKERSNGVIPFHWELAYPEVFLSRDQNFHGGFDVILGNPPYDVLSEREIGHGIEHLGRFISLDITLQPSLMGKNNLYKLFICRSLELLAPGGHMSFIVPMAMLGDEQASELRRTLLSQGEFSVIHAFPQKDIPTRRVFRDAKLSTAIFAYHKLASGETSSGSFVSQVHPAQFIEGSSLSLRLDSNSIKIYDPDNLTIVSCSQEDWDLVASLGEGSIRRLREFVEFSQGEVNQTVATAAGFLTDSRHGQLVIRGAGICRYQLREASQGEEIYLNVAAFLKGKGPDTKAFHHLDERVGLQESSPQNNFRRVIACRIPKGNFCNHKINYTTEHHAKIPLELVLFVLNSSFTDWYFRLGSTNAAVSHYQLNNLPCPRFGESTKVFNAKAHASMASLLAKGDFAALEHDVLELSGTEGSSPTVEKIIVDIVKFIEEKELQRGDISRTARSKLSDEGQVCQSVLDKLMLGLMGLDTGKAQYIDKRLSVML